jgi:transposase
MLGRRPPRQLGLQILPLTVPDTSPQKLLQQIGEVVDLEFVRGLAAPYFADWGRPSIDPVVMIKMMLVGYLFGVPSDRQLVDECADRLSFREFLGYDIQEPMPSHASFTNWRKRLGAEFFAEVLHEIVRQCVAHGMKLSDARTVDATAVKAQADKNGPIVEVPKDADIDEFLDDYFNGNVQSADRDQTKTTPINTHDPDARAQAKRDQPYAYWYQVSFSVDAENGLICDATASGTERAETAVEHVDNDPYEVTQLCADSLYDNGQALAQLQDRGVQTYVPKTNHDKPGCLSKDRFSYDADANAYTCPEGKILDCYRYDEKKQLYYYIAKMTDCGDCPLKAQCTKTKRRTVTRGANEGAREQTIRAGPRYDELMVRRNVNEHVNLLAKRDHGMRNARGLGVEAMRIQAALTAVAIDLKKLVRWRVSLALLLGALSARHGRFDTYRAARASNLHMATPAVTHASWRPHQDPLAKAGTF